MSQLRLAAEVVLLLELTATIRPNSAVMSVAEESGITHFKTLLQRWAHSVYCCRRTWGIKDICQVHTKSLFIPTSQCYCHNTVNHESGNEHWDMLKICLEKLTGGFVTSLENREYRESDSLWIYSQQKLSFLFDSFKKWADNKSKKNIGELCTIPINPFIKGTHWSVSSVIIFLSCTFSIKKM